MVDRKRQELQQCFAEKKHLPFQCWHYLPVSAAEKDKSKETKYRAKPLSPEKNVIDFD